VFDPNYEANVDFVLRLPEERQRWQSHGQRGHLVVYAFRLFTYPMVGTASLILSPHDCAERPWKAELSRSPGEDAMDTVKGTWPVVGPWVDKWEKLLELPFDLAGCRNARQARRMTETIRAGDAAGLCRLFNIRDGREEPRRALADAFAPKRARSWI
jgi:hypothetical protein